MFPSGCDIHAKSVRSIINEWYRHWVWSQQFWFQIKINVKIKIQTINQIKNYDYSSNGFYFITLCSRDRQNLFGPLKNAVGAPLACARHDNIEWSYLGQIIDKQWNDLMIHYENIIWDDYIIMPNHIHGIIIVNKRAEASAAPTISQIIRSFKSRSTLEYIRYIKENNLNVSGKIWQRSFYDQIIRNNRSLNAIKEYIQNNPINWENDIENLINL